MEELRIGTIEVLQVTQFNELFSLDTALANSIEKYGASCPLAPPENPITRKKVRAALRRGFIESNPET